MENILSYSTFDPRNISWQYKVIWDQANTWAYSLGTIRVLFSGSVGSAKTTLAAFMAINHCTKFNRANILLGRRSLPDLRDTIYKDIVDLLDSDDSLIEGIDYVTYDNTCVIKFLKTKSVIFARTWGDKRYKKFRSLKISMAIIEEATENNEEDQQAIREIMQRLNRISHIKENTLLLLTNPDSPGHWIYRDVIERADEPGTYVYYSLTEQNKFLDPGYIEFLKSNLTKKEADRQLRGMWVEIDSNRIYYAYDSAINYLPETKYTINPKYPVALMCDFNIGKGKPMSWALGQEIEGVYHVFKEFHADTMRTTQLLDEMAEQGVFDLPVTWEIYGDAAGSYNDTRSNWSDWEIIESYLSKYRRPNGSLLEYALFVPKANPPLRRRHNIANAHFLNDKGESRFFIYKGCKWVDEGFRLTEPKKGVDNVEDDSLAQQHVTTAITYWIDYKVYRYIDRTKPVMRKNI